MHIRQEYRIGVEKLRNVLSSLKKPAPKIRDLIDFAYLYYEYYIEN